MDGTEDDTIYSEDSLELDDDEEMEDEFETDSEDETDGDEETKEPGCQANWRFSNLSQVKQKKETLLLLYSEIVEDIQNQETQEAACIFEEEEGN
ncbi:hypothetical protein ACROYT_G014579 [Oculina patagonica]